MESRPAQRLSCTAAPARDAAGGIVGVLDLTGGSVAGSHVALALVRATVTMVERELATRAGALGASCRCGMPRSCSCSSSTLAVSAPRSSRCCCTPATCPWSPYARRSRVLERRLS